MRFLRSENIFYNSASISQLDRQLLYSHKSCVLWLTGLSGSGKSTIAFELEKCLFMNKIKTYVLDGDNLRTGLNQNLGFSVDDRMENNRRIAEVAKLFIDAGIFTICASISPFREGRLLARQLFQPGRFFEIYIDCPVNECIRRDPKGLYSKAASGEISNFTGISASYEAPDRPDLVVKTDRLTIEESVQKIIQFINSNELI
ncbi:adenylyl-sulfate kinase [Paenibacillus gansuensis]|uniref:Adenylyl-sulfate kinase n=1 Tax=Paenibacillus gansuensis TaxID=306542 RepID=A0ABW5PJN5_9BACL